LSGQTAGLDGCCAASIAEFGLHQAFYNNDDHVELSWDKEQVSDQVHMIGLN